MNFRTFYILLLLPATQLFCLPGKAQVTDSVPVFRNIIRVNLSNPVLFGIRNNIVGYERILKNNRSLSVNAGRFSFPKFEPFFSDSFQLQRHYKDHGFHLSMDFRWYLLNENKYDAPRGLFIGPYYAYNYLNRENYWTLTMNSHNGELISDLTMNMHLVGIQLGCQFVVWKRLTLDVIFMGPGLWFFDLKSKTSSALEAGDKELIYLELNEQLKNKIPGYNMVIDDNEFSKKGSARTGAFGYRYLVNLGYRF